MSILRGERSRHKNDVMMIMVTLSFVFVLISHLMFFFSFISSNIQIDILQSDEDIAILN